MLPQRFYWLLEALTPIAHGDSLTGTDNATNLRLFMRAGQFVNGRPHRVPSISENMVRSAMVRIPLHNHLLDTLGIEKGSLPQAVTSLLFNGGSIEKGSKSPTDEFALGHQIKKNYPSLDLLGGATGSFILPPSRLRPCVWILARENAFALRHVAPQFEAEAQQTSLFECLFEEMRTQGTGGDTSREHQHLYSYEVMAAGTKVLLEMTVTAHASMETTSSLMTAFSSWDGYIGGQGRQGRGRMAILMQPELSPAPYLDYIAAQSETLRVGLVDGTLGTGKVLCAD